MLISILIVAEEFDCCICHEYLFLGDYRGILQDCGHDSFCYPCADSLFVNSAFWLKFNEMDIEK